VRIELVSGDARRLPFADHTFDVAVSSWEQDREEQTERKRRLALWLVAVVLCTGLLGGIAGVGFLGYRPRDVAAAATSPEE